MSKVACIGLASVDVNDVRDALDVWNERLPAARWHVIRGDRHGEVLYVAGLRATVWGSALDLPALLENANVVLLGARTPYRDARAVRRFSWRTRVGIVTVGTPEEPPCI
jgi:hypothetical protein